MLGHGALRCKLEPGFDRVCVATCDREIADYCASIGIEAVMTSDRHERATDRVQEAVQNIEQAEGNRFSSVTMVQGDEPMVTPEMLRTALGGLRDGGAPVVNLMSLITDEQEFNSPNCVKVVTDLTGHALYFSREPIPSKKKYKSTPKSYKQVCIIPFQRDFLDTYSALEPTYLEVVESVDMMRVLEHGHRLLCLEIQGASYPVDVPEDVNRVEDAMREDPYLKRYHQ